MKIRHKITVWGSHNAYLGTKRVFESASEFDLVCWLWENNHKEYVQKHFPEYVKRLKEIYS